MITEIQLAKIKAYKEALKELQEAENKIEQLVYDELNLATSCQREWIFDWLFNDQDEHVAFKQAGLI